MDEHKDEMDLTEEQEEMLSEWLKRFDYLLGYSMMKEWLEHGGIVISALNTASLMMNLIEGLMDGKYPYAGTSPRCGENPDCSNSIWDGIICNVGEELASVVKIAFAPQGSGPNDVKDGFDNEKEKFREIYGSFVQELFDEEE